MPGIFGFSALLTGGGFAAATVRGGPAAFILCSATSALGVDGRVEDLLECCEMRSLTLLRGVLSFRSGDLDVLLAKKFRGGELGDSTLTDGVNLGDDPLSIDMTCRCPGFGGDWLLLFSCRGVSGESPCVLAVDQGERGRGRSKDALTGGSGEWESGALYEMGESLWLGTSCCDGALRPSNCARNEDTGLMEASSVTFF